MIDAKKLRRDTVGGYAPTHKVAIELRTLGLEYITQPAPYSRGDIPLVSPEAAQTYKTWLLEPKVSTKPKLREGTLVARLESMRLEVNELRQERVRLESVVTGLVDKQDVERQMRRIVDGIPDTKMLPSAPRAQVPEAPKLKHPKVLLIGPWRQDQATRVERLLGNGRELTFTKDAFKAGHFDLVVCWTPGGGTAGQIHADVKRMHAGTRILFVHGGITTIVTAVLAQKEPDHAE